MKKHVSAITVLLSTCLSFPLPCGAQSPQTLNVSGWINRKIGSDEIYIKDCHDNRSFRVWQSENAVEKLFDEARRINVVYPVSIGGQLTYATIEARSVENPFLCRADLKQKGCITLVRTVAIADTRKGIPCK